MTLVKNENFLKRLNDLTSRKIENTTVSVDIPRLLKNFKIIYKKEEIYFNTNEDRESEINKFLNKISLSIENEKVEFDNYLDVDRLKSLLKSKADSNLVKVLKYISQSLIILPVTF